MSVKHFSPAMHAVVKQEMFAWNMARIIRRDMRGRRGGHTTSHTPTAIAKVDKLQKPHSAYVPRALLLSWKCNVTLW